MKNGYLYSGNELIEGIIKYLGGEFVDFTIQGTPGTHGSEPPENPVYHLMDSTIHVFSYSGKMFIFSDDESKANSLVNKLNEKLTDAGFGLLKKIENKKSGEKIL